MQGVRCPKTNILPSKKTWRAASGIRREKAKLREWFFKHLESCTRKGTSLQSWNLFPHNIYSQILPSSVIPSVCRGSPSWPQIRIIRADTFFSINIYIEMLRNQTRCQIGITEGGNQVLIFKSSSDDANVWPDWESPNRSRRQGSTLEARRMSESPKGLWEARCWS